MSGPRVTSGTDSKQDYATPDDFMSACKSRFGEITFDLAAHAGNARHGRYFAPATFDVVVDYDKMKEDDIINLKASLVRQGAAFKDVDVISLRPETSAVKQQYQIKNSDPRATTFDSLQQDWAFHGWGGVLWLNCEFNDCATWAKKCKAEAERGAVVLLLTPASVGTNWFRDDIAAFADVYLLNGRLCFDGKNLYPKDCMLSHYYKKQSQVSPREISIWNWKKDTIEHRWSKVNQP